MQAFKALCSAAGSIYSAFSPKRALSRVDTTQHKDKAPKVDPGGTAFEACVIGVGQAQGNCAICHGTLLYLGEKQLRVEITRFMDESLNDPWVSQVCPGDIKMPVVHALPEDRWLCGTEAIWGYIEEHCRQAPDLGRPVAELSDGVVLGQLAPGMAGDRVFQLLKAALEQGTAGEAERAQALGELEGLLRQLDDWLAERGLPFLGGDAPNATDCYLAPKLWHAVLSLKDLRGWELPEDLQALHRYLALWRERNSWRQSKFDEGLAVDYWRRKAGATTAHTAGAGAGAPGAPEEGAAGGKGVVGAEGTKPPDGGAPAMPTTAGTAGAGPEAGSPRRSRSPKGKKGAKGASPRKSSGGGAEEPPRLAVDEWEAGGRGQEMQL